MIINTEKLKITSTNFNKILDDYYNNSSNVYNIYSNLHNCWNDGDTKKFERDIQLLKIANERYIIEIRSLLEYYNKVIKLYSSFGKTMYIELNEIPNVINKLSDSKKILDLVIIRLQSINKGLTPELTKYIDYVYNKCKVISKELNEVLSDIRKSYKQISENEDILHTELVRLSIKEIKGDIN